MARYTIEPTTRRYVKGYVFLSLAANLSDKYGGKVLHTATKTGLHHAKTASKKVVHKAAEATGVLIGNKITENIVKRKLVPDEN